MEHSEFIVDIRNKRHGQLFYRNQQSRSAEMATLTIRDFGTPDFQAIDIDPVAVAEGLQAYINRGSKLTGVSLDEISTSVCELPTNPATVTLVGLLKIGMKLFDAIVWLSAGRPATHPLTVDTGMDKDDIISLQHVASAVFYVYFFLLTQARYPAAQGTAAAPRVPNFLSGIMGLTAPQWFYVAAICSFNVTKFDPRWIEHVNFNGLGQEALARFGLGVAGYRMFGPFKLMTPEGPGAAARQDAIEFASTVARAKPTWDVHPVTRNPAILTSRGNLNKNLGNLILDVYTPQQIQTLVEAKILYATPTREPAATNYLRWNRQDDISGTNFIF